LPGFDETPMTTDEHTSPPPPPPEKLYDHAAIEPRWQRFWEENRTFASKRRPGRKKRYLLDMFPYPSGAGLHVGHPEGYTATDIVARYARMRGDDVLHPMGWDAFGLPAEQHAIETGTHPAATTHANIATFRRQLKMLGFSYDWDRELATTDVDYVRWTQWIFLQLFKRGLAYQDEIPVNWCPALGTVLANEEVKDGLSERGNHPVVRTPLRQWMLKITAYADRLEKDLGLCDWPEGTLTMQRDWIGRSEGAEIHFDVANEDDEPPPEKPIAVFTTRPDTLMGVTYVVLAPEHPLVAKVTSPQRRSDRDRSQARTKTGVPTGAHAMHPLSGERVPIWVADYVIGSYGTGAVMAVPGHDERDFEFARTYGLPIVEVVSRDGMMHDRLDEAFTGEGVAVRSDAFDGLRTPECKKAIVAELEKHGRGKPVVTYKLRDWVFSRQRYWGEPIPVYFPVETDGDPRTGARHVVRYDEPIAVEESELPLRLPDLKDFRPGDDPMGPLARAADWRFFQKDGQWFARETNTMPQWAGSCWYFLRYIDPENADRPWSAELEKYWLPVDLYVGGAEHAVLHLLYARFWHKVLFDEGKVSHPEPFARLVHQGMILGEDGEKMSKSRGNVVNPDDVVKAHGADSLRLYEMFMGPLEAVKPWQSGQINGVVRFRDRVFNVCALKARGGEVDEPTRRLLHKTIKKVTADIEVLSFNTAISAMMVLANHLGGLEAVPEEAARTLALLVSPFAPHLGEEVWSRQGQTTSIAHAEWPVWDEALTIDDTIEVGVQVNGKVRGRVLVARAASEADARALAEAAEGVGGFLEGKTVKKFVYVPGRIINFVVG